MIPKFYTLPKGEIYSYAMTITTQAEADRFLGAVVASMMADDRSKSKGYYEDLVRSNIGYYAGYYSQETRERMEKLFKAVHPVFGPASKKWTPEQLFAMGAGMACLKFEYKGKSPEELIKIGQAEIDRRRATEPLDSGFTLVEVLVAVAIVAILMALGVGIHDQFKIAQQRITNSIPEDPPNHLIYKTNFLILSGLEEDPQTELPPGYAILSNEWGGFVFRDGDSLVHPFWADGAWQTEEQAIRAAWLSHVRRGKEQRGLLKPPNYLVIRTNQTNHVQEAPK